MPTYIMKIVLLYCNVAVMFATEAPLIVLLSNSVTLKLARLSIRLLLNAVSPVKFNASALQSSIDQ